MEGNQVGGIDARDESPWFEFRRECWENSRHTSNYKPSSYVSWYTCNEGPCVPGDFFSRVIYFKIHCSSKDHYLVM
jgi:hypothetical protein